MDQLRKAFRTSKIKVTQFPKESRDSLEALFIAYEASKTDSVEADRNALISVNKAQMLSAQAKIAETELMKAAALLNNQIAGSRQWIAYKDDDGILVFEGVTDRMIRNTFRAQQDMLGKQMSEIEDEIDREDLYEMGSEEDEDRLND